MSMRYPTEIFEVTKEIVENWERFSVIISDGFRFEDVQDPLVTASTPGSAVIVTFE